MRAVTGGGMLPEEDEKDGRGNQGEEQHPSPRTGAARRGGEPPVPAYAMRGRTIHGLSSTVGGCRETLRVRGVAGECADRNGSWHGGIVVPVRHRMQERRRCAAALQTPNVRGSSSRRSIAQHYKVDVLAGPETGGDGSHLGDGGRAPCSPTRVPIACVQMPSTGAR